MKTGIFAIFMGLAVVLQASAQDQIKTNASVSSQVIEIRKQIELLKMHRGQVLDIREVDGKGWVQICLGDVGKEADVQFSFFPSKDKPAKVFPSVGMKLPGTWKEGVFEPGDTAALSVPDDDITKQLPQVVHEYFIKFLKRPATYKVTFKL